MMRFITLALMTFLILGCAPLAPENSGVTVDVYPVRYEMSLMLNKKKMKAAQQEWQRFSKQHQDLLLTQSVTFFYANSTGKNKAIDWRNALIKRGAERDNVFLEEKKDLNKFDMRVQILSYKTVTPICNPMIVGHFQKQPMGCAVNSNLWHSMTHPQDALGSTNQLQD
ncbi:hypothetical protein DZ860_17275 [Vibrio sinensis]|uniref:Lipoprotein n=1 Tax=Vibrio sinensis TaxID=2302434 RepID=A0A3A6QEK8_9VIBR|nr:hypothetical protein [Vibrio sinensis]RJX68444.1 hypothetical protein DZ860_17275 [Vibrio sinensis]